MPRWRGTWRSNWGKWNGPWAGRPAALPENAALTEEQRALADDDRRLRHRAVEPARELAGGRLQALDTFNVVLFGRTGAGKSSLVEALTGGDGARISPGRADFTTKVEDVRWAGLRLFDTPGTNGWGRDGDNRHLEEAARQAVLLADVVLLCFDDDSQLEGEFAKVAQWVLAHRKPAVVVLNCRTRVWRDPDRVARRRSPPTTTGRRAGDAVGRPASPRTSWTGCAGRSGTVRAVRRRVPDRSGSGCCTGSSPTTRTRPGCWPSWTRWRPIRDPGSRSPAI